MLASLTLLSNHRQLLFLSAVSIQSIYLYPKVRGFFLKNFLKKNFLKMN